MSEMKARITICPATMFANNRTLKLIKRAKFDTNSKITNNKTKANGNPTGKNCVIIDQYLFCTPHKYIHVKNIYAIYNGNNKEDVTVKEYVTNPETLNIIIDKNKKNIRLTCSNLEIFAFFTVDKHTL